LSEEDGGGDQSPQEPARQARTQSHKLHFSSTLSPGFAALSSLYNTSSILGMGGDYANEK
jgi:hypothetical protein